MFCIFAIELFLGIDAVIFLHRMYKQFSSFVNLMSTKYVSDHWKERVVPVYALIIIINALKFLGVMLFIVALFLGLMIIFPGFFNFTTSIFGIVVVLLFSLTYLKIRQKLIIIYS